MVFVRFRAGGVAASTLLSLAALAPASPRGGGAWTAGFAAAKTRAAAEGKDLLLEFTGSDWCPPCIRLTKEVFSLAEFQEAAGERYVLVVVDNPRGPDVITKETRAQNDRLHAEYAVNKWPTILLADAEGRPYARTEDFRPGGPAGYLEHLAELQLAKTRRDALFAEAEGLEGVERARKLDQAIASCGDFIPAAPYAAAVDAIIAADADGAAGLKQRWETRRAADQLEIELPRLGQAGQWQELVDRIGAFLEQHEPAAPVKQKALYWRGLGYSRLERKDDAIAALTAAVAIAPAAEFGERAQALLDRLQR